MSVSVTGLAKVPWAYLGLSVGLAPARRMHLHAARVDSSAGVVLYDRGVPETTGLEDTLVRGYRQLALETPARPRDAVLRALDIVFSTFFLLISLPISLLLALVVVVTSGLPVLYRGERVGRSGHVFTMFKFRTLRRGAEHRLGTHLGEDLVEATESRVHADRPLAQGDTARRDSAVRQRPPRRHESRRAASDSAGLLRGARARAAVVLAAARRPPRTDRVRAGASRLRDVDGREARARPRVDRRPLGPALPPHALRDRLARASSSRSSGIFGRRA